MNGSKRERSPGVWEVRVPGRSVTVHGDADTADAARRALVARAEAGEFSPERRRITNVTSLLEWWLVEGTEEGWSPTTLHRNSWFVRRHIIPRIGTKRASELRPVEISDMYRQLGRDVGKPTAGQAHRLLSSAYSNAMRSDLIDSNPCERVKPPKVPRPRVRAVTLGDVVDVMNAARERGDHDMAMLIRVAAATGCRRGELAALRWFDVDLDRAQVTISRSMVELPGAAVPLLEKTTKSGNVRHVALDAGTVDALRAWHALTDAAPRSLVWTRGDGEPWSPSMITARWARLAKSVGLDARFHDVRHANGSLLVRSGVAPAEAAQRLGHSTDVLLRIYAHDLPTRGRDHADLIGGELDARRDSAPA